jgi:hypothetical protein
MHQIEVYLNGDRDYIQGSQILARSAVLVNNRYPGSCLISAGFNHITKHNVIAIISPGNETTNNEKTGHEIGRAQFVCGQINIPVSFYETREQANRCDLLQRVILKPVDNPKTTDNIARFVYSNVHSFEDCLDMIVQSAKMHHIRSTPDIYDVWFTGIRGCMIPAMPDEDTISGVIDIEIVRSTSKQLQWQTISRIEIRAENGNVYRAVVSFAYKSMG